MTDKELRRLKKTELLWIIRDQEEEILELKKRLEKKESVSTSEADDIDKLLESILAEDERND